MLRVRDIALPLDGDMELLRKRTAQALGVRPGQLEELVLVKQSIDARDKGKVHYVYTVDAVLPQEDAVLRQARGKVSLHKPEPYRFPAIRRSSALPPVVAGMGPAGLFAALFLARAGLPPVVLERGREVDSRVRDVERFWAGGTLDENSNVQFGEGGAGAFSDGKLTTGTHDRRIAAVLDTLTAFGAPSDIVWSSRPHVGTDLLRNVVKNIRGELIKLGCDLRFQTKLHSLRIESGALAGIAVRSPAGQYELPCDSLILAPGHSARDTFRMLSSVGVPMQPKSFAIGVRIEHSQRKINMQQYGPAWEQLPPADYKLACHLSSGRSVFTFCVCPGGQVVAAASGKGGVVTNGMSYRARNGKNINGGLLVGITPADFPEGDVLAGVEFQKRWEQAAFLAGGGDYHAPAQRVEDFLADRASQGAGLIRPTYRPGVVWGKLDSCLPEYVTGSLRQALPLLDRKLRGFAEPDGVLIGVETRSSSPVRILRGEDCQSALKGLYPCGEGAGYAGGIMSAAVDGIRAAEAVAGGG